jgi:hypothetical protein
MNNDTQIIHHLWWLRSFLDRQFSNKEYKQVIDEELDTDTIKELESLLTHIKENY